MTPEMRHQAERCEAAGRTLPANFTGTIRGEIVTDRDGTPWAAVYEYEGGECIDRYLTKAGGAR